MSPNFSVLSCQIAPWTSIVLNYMRLLFCSISTGGKKWKIAVTYCKVFHGGCGEFNFQPKGLNWFFVKIIWHCLPFWNSSVLYTTIFRWCVSKHNIIFTNFFSGGSGFVTRSADRSLKEVFCDSQRWFGEVWRLLPSCRPWPLISCS